MLIIKEAQKGKVMNEILKQTLHKISHNTYNN
jgi:hypothetical protein